MRAENKNEQTQREDVSKTYFYNLWTETSTLTRAKAPPLTLTPHKSTPPEEGLHVVLYTLRPAAVAHGRGAFLG